MKEYNDPRAQEYVLIYCTIQTNLTTYEQMTEWDNGFNQLTENTGTNKRYGMQSYLQIYSYLQICMTI